MEAELALLHERINDWRPPFHSYFMSSRTRSELPVAVPRHQGLSPLPSSSDPVYFVRGVSRAGMPIPAPILCFQQVYAAVTLVTPAGTAHTPFRHELAHSTRVDARKHGNASIGAVAARI